MNMGFMEGQLAVCFCVLAMLTVFLFTDRRRERTLDGLLCAAVLLLCAVTLFLAGRIGPQVETAHTFRVNDIVSAVLSFAALAALTVSFWFWEPAEGSAGRWLPLVVSLLPVWLAGLGWLLTRKAAVFCVAETLSLLTAIAFYQRNAGTALQQRAEEIENHQAMLFQWQMRPHFLFNTMSTIREMMNTDPAAASAGLDNLAGYLRKNLDALTLDYLIPFERELKHIDQYVMLEKMNPANRFEVVYDLQMIDFRLPALCVQPLVENAIRHGVRGMDGEGMIFVATEPHGDMIRIVVEDNGPGFAGDSTEQQNRHAGQGLENVRRRLETRCGGTLHVHSGADGTRLIVLIPKRG